MISKEDIYGLDDGALAKALYVARTEAPLILRTKWEEALARGVEEAVVRYGGLTWKQRKSAREILVRVLDEAERRQAIREG